MSQRGSFLEMGLLALVVGVLIWSGIAPHDRFTWVLEVAPVLLGLPILILIRDRFRFSSLVLVLLAIHAVILMVGGKYTYAEVPVGFWVSEWMGFARNHYDRLGHFAQGFVPALVFREVLLRRSPLRGSRWLSFVVICFALALSATYELIEWATAVLTGTAAEAFLGTQGDIWDTQWDMFLALIGALVALAVFRRAQDRATDRMVMDSSIPSPPAGR